MKKWTGMLLLWIACCLSWHAQAQRQTEYNRKGDEALQRKDYRDAKMWFEEGVFAECDRYSIDRLTTIWLEDETMHVSMRTVMNKCFNCLTEWATERDTFAIDKLILYYSRGIGTAENPVTADYWRRQLETVRRQNRGEGEAPTTTPTSATPMRFFFGYQASLLAPFGIRVGGIVGRLGWYIAAQSNFSFQGHTATCRTADGRFIIEGQSGYYGYMDRKQANVLMASVGLIIRTLPGIYTSVGAGYWQRDLIRQYGTADNAGNIYQRAWAKDLDASEKGLKVDLGATYLLPRGRYYVTGECTVLNFRYLYPALGVGMIF